MEEELRYDELREIFRVSPEVLPQLLEIQKMAEETSDDPEGMVAFLLLSWAMGQCYKKVRGTHNDYAESQQDTAKLGLREG